MRRLEVRAEDARRGKELGPLSGASDLELGVCKPEVIVVQPLADIVGDACAEGQEELNKRKAFHGGYARVTCNGWHVVGVADGQ